MELVAAIRGLESLEQDARVQVYTDSQYVRNGILEWMKSWKSNGWRTAAGKPVKNRDLWLVLDEASGYRQVEWRWVRGHAGNSGNERADALANTAIDEYLASVAGRPR
jgi:ribonuclease HI